jgi:toxin ParE1/3/4
MTVRWTPTALRDLESLDAHIAEDAPEAAAATVERILSGIEALRRHPEMGRRGRVPGTRELVIAPWIVAHRAAQAAIEILAVIHGARRWPDSL